MMEDIVHYPTMEALSAAPPPEDMEIVWYHAKKPFHARADERMPKTYKDKLRNGTKFRLVYAEWWRDKNFTGPLDPQDGPVCHRWYIIIRGRQPGVVPGR